MVLRPLPPQPQPGVTATVTSDDRRGEALVPEVGARVDRLPFDHDLVVQVRSRRAAGVAGVADDGATHDPLRPAARSASTGGRRASGCPVRGRARPRCRSPARRPRARRCRRPARRSACRSRRGCRCRCGTRGLRCHGDWRVPYSELTAPRTGQRVGSEASMRPARAMSRSSARRLSVCSLTESPSRFSSSIGDSRAGAPSEVGVPPPMPRSRPPAGASSGPSGSQIFACSSRQPDTSWRSSATRRLKVLIVTRCCCDLLAERHGFAGQLAQLDPVPDQDAGDGDDHGEGDAHADGDRTREVEAEHPLAVAPDDEQAELPAAIHTGGPPSRSRPGECA